MNDYMKFFNSDLFDDTNMYKKLYTNVYIKHVNNFTPLLCVKDFVNENENVKDTNKIAFSVKNIAECCNSIKSTN